MENFFISEDQLAREEAAAQQRRLHLLEEGVQQGKAPAAKQQLEGAEEEDPLDAFMCGISKQIAADNEASRLKREREAEAAVVAEPSFPEKAKAHMKTHALPTSVKTYTPYTESAINPPESAQIEARFFGDENDDFADSFEHVLEQRRKAEEAQLARAAQGRARRKKDGTLYEDDDYSNESGAARLKDLPPVDHSKLQYPSFVRDIYKEARQIEELTHAAVGELKRSLQLRTIGKNAPRPIASFLHLRDTLSPALFNGLHKRGFSLPTPIQSAAIPCLLRGRDVIGMAETGSGKTAAYLIPLVARLQHLREQQRWHKQQVFADAEYEQAATPCYSSSATAAKDSNKSSDNEFTTTATTAPFRSSAQSLPHGGPAGLILCPTRELAVQIDGEVHALISKSKTTGGAALTLRRVLLAGGFDKTDQYKQLKAGVDLAICNPGRLIDIATMKGMQTVLQKVVITVVDEADKLVQMGFEAPLKSILSSLRPDRITCMFSATFPARCEVLTEQYLKNPIKIIVGEQGQAARSVEQHVAILRDERKKFQWLADNILSLLTQASEEQTSEEAAAIAPAPPAAAAAAARNSSGAERSHGRVAVIFCNTQQRCEDLAHLLEEELSRQLHTQRQRGGRLRGGLKGVLSAADDNKEEEEEEDAGDVGDQALQQKWAAELEDSAAAGAAVAAPSTKAAAARLLQLKEDDDTQFALKKNAEQTFKYLTIVHGGLNQTERLAAIRRLHQHILHPPPSVGAVANGAPAIAPLVLVATDVAARGLDFPGALSLVISYDAPQEAEVYVHRIGRAGRAGRTGKAFALLTRGEKRTAALIAESMRSVGQEPPRLLFDLAMQYPPFKTATLSGVKMEESHKAGGGRGKQGSGNRRFDSGLAGLGYTSTSSGNNRSSTGGTDVAALVARAATAAAAAVMKQQQAMDVHESGVTVGTSKSQHVEEVAVAAETGEDSSNSTSSKTEQQQVVGAKRGRWDNEFKGGVSTSALTLTQMLAASNSSTAEGDESERLAGTAGKVVGIDDELSSDEDDGTMLHPRPSLQQQFEPAQQAQQSLSTRPGDFSQQAAAAAAAARAAAEQVLAAHNAASQSNSSNTTASKVLQQQRQDFFGDRVAPEYGGRGQQAAPKRSSLLNLDKREQRRRQWLESTEAQREMLRLQKEQQLRQKQQHERAACYSPPRKAFTERPRAQAQQQE